MIMLLLGKLDSWHLPELVEKSPQRAVHAGLGAVLWAIFQPTLVDVKSLTGLAVTYGARQHLYIEQMSSEKHLSGSALWK